jgi:hypothetical protein
MPKNDPDKGKIEKGYQPLNEGYTPKEQRGYAPNSLGGGLPKAPKGGTGESSKPASPTGSAKPKQ